MSESAIDHWYQLHVDRTRPAAPYLIPSVSSIEGPITEAEMLRRAEQIVNCEPDARGHVVHRATGIRVDVGSMETYERSGYQWKPIQSVPHLEQIPCLVTQIGGLKTGEQHSLLLQLNAAGDPIHNWGQLLDGQPRPVPHPNNPNQGVDLHLKVTRVFDMGVDLNRLTDTLAVEPPILSESNDPTAEEAEAEQFNRPIVGFRTWVLNVPSVVVDGAVCESEPQLFGGFWHTRSRFFEWQDAAKTAECPVSTHLTPALNCQCGVYAHHEGYPVLRRVNYRGLSRSDYVDGAVLGSGDVYVYHSGWRAEKARIIGFRGDNVRPQFLPALHRLAAKLDVPVLSAEKLRLLALAKGQSIRKAQIGDAPPSPWELSGY
jgi:hypothetical protein